jgi:hypothetical protein
MVFLDWMFFYLTIIGFKELSGQGNLCRIKKIGLERWIEEESGQIRKIYFTRKFVVGKGQAD